MVDWNWLGIDIGGANIKVATADGYANQCFFPMWKAPDRLSLAIGNLLQNAPRFDGIALTMTGEMADCFATREEGVCQILEQVTRIIPSATIRVFSTPVATTGSKVGTWLSVPDAARNSWSVASANWFAMATFEARFADGLPTIVVDVGSTTTDIIAVQPSKKNQFKVLTKSKSDRDRLLTGELVYTGIERSSIHGLVDSLVFQNQTVPVINELFATTIDAYLILGFAEENLANTNTADGRPQTMQCAAYRLARTIGEDGSTVSSQEIESLAEQIFESQIGLLSKALIRVAMKLDRNECQHIVFSGHGDYLISETIDRLQWKIRRTKLSDKIGELNSRCATAHALAVLAREHFSMPVSP